MKSNRFKFPAIFDRFDNLIIVRALYLLKCTILYCWQISSPNAYSLFWLFPFLRREVVDPHVINIYESSFWSLIYTFISLSKENAQKLMVKIVVHFLIIAGHNIGIKYVFNRSIVIFSGCQVVLFIWKQLALLLWLCQWGATSWSSVIGLWQTMVHV